MSKGKPENSGGNTRDVNAGIRASLALKLRAQQHLSYDEIARQCGFASKGAAHNAVQRELARSIAGSVDEMRREECATLDYLQQTCLTRLRSETHEKAMLFAVDRILAISERRSKLMGMDATNEEMLANVPYEKRVVLIDEPAQGVKA